MAEINLKEGEDAYGLAVMIADLVRQNIEHTPHKEKYLKEINCKIGIAATDIELAITLDFKGNSLDIYNDLVHSPSVIIRSDSNTIIELSLLQIKFGLPYLFDEAGLKFLRKLFKRKIIIEGFLFKLIPVLNLTKLFSVH